ncbi:DUF2254 domain-containing protein [Pedobacter alpinus]|uniref:DUF2254 domain-containing protein n=1 Tax=Pedobacter alpinus TaxID=1590643 RepID=A0ABW5TRR7_9SPHI
MLNNLRYWFINKFQKVLNSISFYPALIGLLFLVLAILMLGFDFSIQGKNVKSYISWLNIKDATTARSIISAIAAGIISLAVFSFSMVMIVLNQAASQMSNRVLDKLIGNRFQQIVLGIYIGTIVYAFFLLSTIRDIDSGLYIPSLSIYLLIIITISDIFLFIYFLHYITQSVKYEVIVRRIFDNTFNVLRNNCAAKTEPTVEIQVNSEYFLHTNKTGIYEGFDSSSFLKICEKHQLIIEILVTPGTSLLKGSPFAKIDKQVDKDVEEDIVSSVFINESESIDVNFFYGFRQLTEVALKALSPGINDPGTAIIAIRSLFELYAYRINHHPLSFIANKDGKACVLVKVLNFDKIFADTMAPIWNYGKTDRMIQEELLLLIPQLQNIGVKHQTVNVLLENVKIEHKKQLF